MKIVVDFGKRETISLEFQVEDERLLWAIEKTTTFSDFKSTSRISLKNQRIKPLFLFWLQGGSSSPTSSEARPAGQCQPGEGQQLQPSSIRGHLTRLCCPQLRPNRLNQPRGPRNKEAKRKEKTSASKERKATKTLAIVLGNLCHNSIAASNTASACVGSQ